MPNEISDREALLCELQRLAINALDICRMLQAVNRAIALNPEITDAELETIIIDFVQTIRVN